MSGLVIEDQTDQTQLSAMKRITIAEAIQASRDMLRQAQEREMQQFQIDPDQCTEDDLVTYGAELMMSQKVIDPDIQIIMDESFWEGRDDER